MKPLYLAGPMSGYPEFNYPAFNAKAAELRGLGFTVCNPAENGLGADASWDEHMRADLAMLLQCDAIYLLPGWSKSRGATLEHAIALELGMAITYGATE